MAEALKLKLREDFDLTKIKDTVGKKGEERAARYFFADSSQKWARSFLSQERVRELVRHQVLDVVNLGDAEVLSVPAKTIALSLSDFSDGSQVAAFYRVERLPELRKIRHGPDKGHYTTEKPIDVYFLIRTQNLQTPANLGGVLANN